MSECRRNSVVAEGNGDGESRIVAFLDEFGDVDLEVEKPGASVLYIPVAVIVNSEDLAAGQGKLREIQGREFSGNQIKSKQVRPERRHRILQALDEVNFHFVAEVFSKTQIERDSGLQYRKTAYKFLNRQLYERLCDAFRSVEIVADRYGTEEFMGSFLPYFKRKYDRPTLFHREPDHRFVQARDEPFVQVADFIAGTLARVFTPEMRTEQSDTFYQLLLPKCLGISGWPPRRRFTPSRETSDSPELDELIRQRAFEQAVTFIERNCESPDTRMQMQVVVLRRLLMESQIGAAGSFLFSDELIDHLNQLGYSEIKGRRQLSERVIGKLRDADVIVTSRSSSSGGGYRIPTCLRDIVSYVDHDAKLIVPMLDRLLNTKTALNLGAMQKLPLFDSQPILGALVDFYQKQRL